ncbi:hypothetical protein J2X36_002140 [Methylobacterium sp. BE186]|uniref:hypothetical protein n=1 Tax=Methylobacterium sp. BE186 TaxID=2817715 RepID=UPI002860F216|nr:hypothetical protein [Methylobacterium sp. BE186]MDR7037393.1 hypothetical protein [Methylobacterium sp. BE186]
MPSSYDVQKTDEIGTTGVLVSGPTTARRVIRNVGAVACELVMVKGAAYGTGHPLPVGESFTFDEAGKMTGPIFVAAASQGGSVSVMAF